jgi:hypothetical protein
MHKMMIFHGTNNLQKSVLTHFIYARNRFIKSVKAVCPHSLKLRPKPIH